MAGDMVTGTVINNRYRIKQSLGQGGCGRVYLADDEQSHQLCVLKEFAPSNNSPNDQPKYRQLFEREAQALKTLSHPQIPRYFGSVEENGRSFLVQEYVKGKTYAQLRQEGQRFSQDEIIQWLRDMLPVLQHIHDQGFIHRDISPDNIIVSDDDSKPKLVDFGVVKKVEAGLRANCASVNSHATVVTKVGYSAPELRTGKCYPSSDLYSLAVTAIVLLTGKNPEELFDSYSLKWHWRQYTQVRDPLAEILDKMLAEKPQDRYQLAREVENKLCQTQVSWLPQTSSFQPSNPKPKLPLRPIGLTLSIFVFVFVGGGLVYSQVPHIAPLCQALDNCAKDREFEQVYNQAIGEAEAAILQAQDFKNLNDLQQAQDNLNKVVDQLKQIPTDVKIYPKVEQRLTVYEARLNKIQERLLREQQAEQQLTDGTKLADEAIKKKPQSFDELYDVYEQLDKAVTQLEEIPASANVSAKAKRRLEDYQYHLNSMKQRLDQEQQAQKQLDQAQRLAREATEQTQVATSLNDWRQVEQRWNKALGILDGIPANVFVAERVTQRQSQYQENRQEIQDKIAQFQPPHLPVSPGNDQNHPSGFEPI
ncbi:serine/threonine-protein kinase [Coleofasciculus chthonoplastes]|uniref:serine/threonine-protein kinase n=1 Tax=Coleofasciculus chthonoplastes TaxID=64178 RepID=UPI000A013C11|nr:serine/threonine-protein kinase [Coleofasciculus chthonoplastes]